MAIRSCAVFLWVTAVFCDYDFLEVKTEQGIVRGRLQSYEDLYVFYNIPYATAPKGDHKFKAPLPPPNWSDPYETIKKNIACPQNKAANQILKEKLELDENCLIANVFVPRTHKKNLSVLVHVHGGAFSLGNGLMNKATQLLKKKDFLMVTFNYRLGVLGFLCLGTEDIPGNAGMKDQVAALRWVQKNIAGFGGNPNDVTIAGSSTGSASVDLLMLSKSSEGLFHKVILESGGGLAPFAVQRDPLQIAKYHASKLNFTNFHDVHALEDLYKTASLELLTSCSFFDRTDSTFLFSPCVERDTGNGEFLTESPLSILKKGNYEKLPILYGFTSMEGLMRIDYFDIWKHKIHNSFSDFLPGDLQFHSIEEKRDVAETVKSFYFGNKSIGDDNVMAFVNYFSDVTITYPMLRALQLYVEAGNDQVYLYEYAFLSEEPLPYPHIGGADHCAQSTAWMDDESERFASQKYQKMRKIIREIWHNFLKTGVPYQNGKKPLWCNCIVHVKKIPSLVARTRDSSNSILKTVAKRMFSPFLRHFMKRMTENPVPKGSSLPTWPPAGGDRSPHMKLGEKLELRGVLLEERTRFWDDIYKRYYRDAVPPPAPGQIIIPLEPESGTTEKILYGFLNRSGQFQK